MLFLELGHRYHYYAIILRASTMRAKTQICVKLHVNFLFSATEFHVWILS